MLNSETVIFGNAIIDYVYATGVFFIFVILFKGFQFFILNKLKNLAKKTKTDLDDTFIRIVRNIKPHFYYFLAFYFATYSLAVSVFFKKIMVGFLVVLVVYQIIVALQILIDYAVGKRIDVSDDTTTDSALSTIAKIAKISLWIIGVLLVLSNFGVNITSLVAGLGIGGIAIAFALQNILSDLFSSFAIYFDKPFQVGDFIKLGEDAGTVEKIGIKTTRLKTPQGEELVISNQELTSARIQNFKQMEERRGLFVIGVTYDTPKSRLEVIPVILKEIIESVDGIRFDRAHFKEFADSSLNFEIVYFVSTNNYMQYMDAQQEINLKILEKFEKEGIEFAFPTQTVYTKSIN